MSEKTTRKERAKLKEKTIVCERAMIKPGEYYTAAQKQAWQDTDSVFKNDPPDPKLDHAAEEYRRLRRSLIVGHTTKKKEAGSSLRLR